MLKLFRKEIWNPAWLLVLLIFCLSGCGNTEIGNPEVSFSGIPDSGADLQVMSSSGELTDYLRNQHTAEIRYNTDTYAGAELSSSDSASIPVQNTPDDVFPLTNAYSDDDRMITQFMETPFVAEEGGIRIIDSELGSPVVDIDGTPVAVFRTEKPKPNSTPLSSTIVAVLYEVTDTDETGIRILEFDRLAPTPYEIIEDSRIEGRFADGIVSDGILHIVIEYWPDVTGLKIDDDSESYAPEDFQTGQDQLDEMTADDFIPAYTLTDDIGQPVLTEPLLTYEDVYLPKNPAGGKMTAIVSIDLLDIFRPVSAVAFVGETGAVHISHTAVYLAGNCGPDPETEMDAETEPEATETLPSPSQTADTENEMIYGGSGTLSSENSPQTAVYQFDFTDKGAEFAAAGYVAGNLAGKTSLNQHSGNIGVITRLTDDSEPSSPVYTYHLYRMQQQELRLVSSGRTALETTDAQPRPFFSEDNVFIAFSGSVLRTTTLSAPSSGASSGLIFFHGTLEAVYPVMPEKGKYIGVGRSDGPADEQTLRLWLLDVSDAAPIIIDQADVRSGSTPIRRISSIALINADWQKITDVPLDSLRAPDAVSLLVEPTDSPSTIYGDMDNDAPMILVYPFWLFPEPDAQFDILGPLFSPLSEETWETWLGAGDLLGFGRFGEIDYVPESTMDNQPEMTIEETSPENDNR